jgi:hypothetical protein
VEKDRKLQNPNQSTIFQFKAVATPFHGASPETNNPNSNRDKVPHRQQPQVRN